ncbi:helix-turn-helix domain-containing protein [Xanthomonas arboricola]|uniref:HTH cro/C1-type domain-containing protein n=1 Tax=Xanthomonas arboricola TaxID=56448 RepID=A0AAU9I733_9XANT|nr:helix-turn-helix transcriptional regulator [Xanthomonas arboricola]CAE6837690.1 hypothetical protein XA1314C_37430 [Xanthomonas arboricola]CAE6837711.1 hypothetical protein XA1314C_37430 [Xanthomonas arboricola]
MAATPFTDGFADRLRNARERAGLTQRELGSEAEVNYSQISRYEQGIAFPRPGVLLKLAQALGTSIEHLRDAERMEEVQVYFGDDDDPLSINVSMADMRLVKEGAKKNGRSFEEEFKALIRAGMSVLADESELVLGSEAPAPKRKR